VLGTVSYLCDAANPANQPAEGEPTLAERFRTHAARLARFYALCSSSPDAGALKNDIAFFEAVRIWIAKYDAEVRRSSGQSVPADVVLYLRQLTAGAIGRPDVSHLLILPGHLTPPSCCPAAWCPHFSVSPPTDRKTRHHEPWLSG
jgi:type I restriction enzyme R subunit